MRDRGNVTDRRNSDACLRDSTDSRFTTSAGPLHANLNFPHSSLCRLSCCITRGLLGSKRRALSGTAKSLRTARRLSNKISTGIGDRNKRVIKGRCNIHDTDRDVLFLFLLVSLLFRCWFCCHIVARGSLLVIRRRQNSNERHATNDQLITYFLPGAFFLATAALRGPFLVRAFVLVRWPRTGKLRL